MKCCSVFSVHLVGFHHSLGSVYIPVVPTVFLLCTSGVGSNASAFLILFHIDITGIFSRFASGCNCECRALWCVTVMQKMSGPLWLFVTVNKLTEERGTVRIPWCDITKGKGLHECRE